MLNQLIMFSSGRKMVAWLALTVLLCLVVQAQPPAQLGLGTEGYERGSAIRPLSDGGFIIGGYTNSYNLPESDMLLIRTDAAGNVKWSRSYGGDNRELINDVLQTADGGFLAVAEKYQADRKQGEFLIVLKTDALGNLQWKKIFDEGGNETEGFSIAPAPDGNFIIAGLVKSVPVAAGSLFTSNDDDQAMFLLKIDGSGNKMWSGSVNTPGGSITSTGISVIVSNDGSYTAVGNMADKVNPAASEKMSLMLVNARADGTLGWAKQYGLALVMSGYNLTQKSDGGLMVAGMCTPENNSENVDFLLMSLDASGKVLWAKSYGGEGFDAAKDVIQAPDGGFIVSGETKSFGAETGDILIFKTDASGNVQWAKIYGGTNEEQGGRITKTSSGIALTGGASIGRESFDVLFARLDGKGNTLCWGKDVSLTVKNMTVSDTPIKDAALTPVKTPKLPPGFKKAVVTDIKEVSRQIRAINICQQ